MNTTRKIVIAILAITTVIVSLLNVFQTEALHFLMDTSEQLLGSLAIVSEIKWSTVLISKIPVLGDEEMSFQTVLDRILNYLSLANILVGIQIVLVNLSKSVLFKLLPLPFIIGIFIQKYSRLSLKILVLSLLLCPGLSIYVCGIKYMATEAHLDLGNNLKEELQKVHDKFVEKERVLNSHLEQEKQNQLAEAEKKGKKKIGLFKKAEDDIEKVVKKTDLKIKEGSSEIVTAVKFLAKKADELIINLIVNILVIFFLLPLLYFYGLNLILKHYFGFEFNRNQITQAKKLLDKVSQKL